MINGKAENCCGCRACGSICPRNAISFNENEKGFTEPRIDLDICVNCNLCNAVCPLENDHLLDQSFTQKYYVAKLKNYKERRKSQSGGVFAALAKRILSQHGIVYGAIVDDGLNVVYSRATNLRDMHKMRGSKYVQADIGNSFENVKKDLESHNKVMFSGTPCYVHGLLTYLNGCKTDVSNLITVDLVCHGTPSPLLYKQYIDLIEKNHRKKVRKFVFRDNEFYGSVFTLSNRAQYQTDDYNKVFYSRFALRDCCFTCHYANMQRVGDLTIGDCWGYEKYNEAFDPNRGGCSLVIANSEKGRKSFYEVLDEFEYEETQRECILQPNLEHPEESPSLTEIFWKDYHEYAGEYVLRTYCKCEPEKEKKVLYKKQTVKKVFRKLYYLVYNSFEH